MSALLVNVKPSPFRLHKKVGGPAHVLRPPPVLHVPLTPGQKRRRLDAAYLERFFARQQRSLATGMLAANERETVRLPKTGRVRALVAQALGLVQNPAAAADDPEATQWIPPAPYGNLVQSPFLPRPRASNATGRDAIKPRLSPFKYRRLWLAARRQGLDHLLPVGPTGLAAKFEEAERRRAEAISDSELLDLAAMHWHKSPGAATQDSLHATAEERDTVMRSFAIRLPKYRHLRSEHRLFPFARARLARKQARAKAIVEALEQMPAKVAAYRKGKHDRKKAATRNSPL